MFVYAAASAFDLSISKEHTEMVFSMDNLQAFRKLIAALAEGASIGIDGIDAPVVPHTLVVDRTVPLAMRGNHRK